MRGDNHIVLEVYRTYQHKYVVAIIRSLLYFKINMATIEMIMEASGRRRKGESWPADDIYLHTPMYRQPCNLWSTTVCDKTYIKYNHLQPTNTIEGH